MKCEKTDELINLEIDGLLPQADREAFARHLQSCPACAERRRQLRETAQQLLTLPRLTLPASFAQAVIAKLPSVDRSPALYSLKGALAAAMIAVLGLVLLLMPMEGYRTDVDEYGPSLAETEVDSVLPSVNPAIDIAALQAEAAFGSLLDAAASVRFGFVVGTSLLLASIGLAFLYLMHEAAGRPRPSAATIRLRRVRPHG